MKQKVRWRMHGIVLVTTVMAMMIVHCLLQSWNLSEKQIADFARPFQQNHRQFNFYYRVLLPQVGSLLLLYGCYLYINLKIMPALRKSVLAPAPAARLQPLTGIMLQIIGICFLLGPVFNIVSFYINPYYLNFQFSSIHFITMPLTFGYHPQPFNNLFGGFGISSALVVIYLVCIGIREMLIHYLEQSAYKTMVANQVTTAFLFFFITPIYWSVFDVFNSRGDNSIYHYYFSFVSLTIIVLQSNIYWLFPFYKSESVFNYRLITRLLLSTFCYTVFCSILLFSDWSFKTFLLLWAFELFLFSAFSLLVYRIMQDRISSFLNMETALARSTADLQFLRSQINPHFLFNALNTLYGTALIEGSKKTADGIQKLGDMMRFMLHDNTLDLIPMHREIEYLKNYISLQKLRTVSSPDITIQDEITVEQADLMIAPMLLIPFVENAFKHGISLTEKSWIKIELQAEGQLIRFEVRNSRHQERDGDTEQAQSGIGLQNVQSRLSLLYPGKHQFSFGKINDEFVVNLSVQLKKYIS